MHDDHTEEGRNRERATNALSQKQLAERFAEAGDFDAAIRCWQQALALQPQQTALYLGLSAALVDAGHYAEAEDAVQTALRLQPNSAAVQFGLGNLREAQGQRADAENAFRAALRAYPAFTLACQRLVRLLRGQVSVADRAALEARLADPTLPEGCRVTLLFALATVHDARGAFAEASRCSEQANALDAERARRRGTVYDPTTHRRFVDALLRTFDADFFRRTAGGGVATRKPIFVFGMPRSGTSLVEQILATHPAVHGAGELRLAWQTLEAVPRQVGRAGDPLACVPALDGTALRRLGELHLARLEAQDHGCARVIDKMPDNYLYLGLLAALFPQATFLHCRRDPRDIAVSCWLTSFTRVPWANDVDAIATRCADYHRVMAHWRNVLPVPLVEVDYEDLVLDLEANARRLVMACGLEWDPVCLEFHRTARPVRTSSSVQVRTPLYGRSVGRWRHYEPFLPRLFARLAEERSAERL